MDAKDGPQVQSLSSESPPHSQGQAKTPSFVKWMRMELAQAGHEDSTKLYPSPLALSRCRDEQPFSFCRQEKDKGHLCQDRAWAAGSWKNKALGQMLRAHILAPPQTGGLKTAVYSLTALETRNPKSRCRQAHAPLTVPGGAPLISSSSWWSQGPCLGAPSSRVSFCRCKNVSEHLGRLF